MSAHDYLVVGPDGATCHVQLPRRLAARAPAPTWLLSRLGQGGRAAGSCPWYLLPFPGAACGEEPRRLCLVPNLTAAAAPRDPRQARLKTERERLEKLNRESDHVSVKPHDVLPGSEPERYRATFRCRGIAAIDSSRKPIFADTHIVEIYCDEDFPADVPRLRWVTPIWHPNILHLEPKAVCVNKSEWLGGMGLDDLCRQMFEMVQYKNYHAQATPPFPLDREVAKWVLEFAEPKGIVSKSGGIFVDDKPFVRPARQPAPAPPSASPAPASRIKVSPRPATPPPAPPAPRSVRLLPPPATERSGDTASAGSSRVKVSKKS